MTSAEARAAAVATVRAQMGLDKLPPSEWLLEQRQAYNKALAAYILANPVGFTSQDAGTAAHVASTNYEPLSDTSFDWAMFGDAVAEEAGKTAAGFKFSLGTGVVVAIVALAVLIFFRYAPARRA